MTKGNPQDLKDLADDLQETLHKHPNAAQHNPDIANDIRSARDKAAAKYRRIVGEDPEGELTH